MKNETEELDAAAKAGASKAYRNVTKRLASALGIEPTHTRFPSQDIEPVLKRVLYCQERLKIMDEQKRKAGQPIRYPRLDKTRNRPLVIS